MDCLEWDSGHWYGKLEIRSYFFAELDPLIKDGIILRQNILNMIAIFVGKYLNNMHTNGALVQYLLGNKPHETYLRLSLLHCL